MKKQEFRMLSDAELLDPKTYWIQWQITRNVRDVESRREWLEIVSTELARNKKTLVKEDGKPFDFPEYDVVFDPDMRQLSDYLAPDRSGLLPFRRSNKLERLRLFNAAIRMRYPNIAHLLCGGAS